MTFPMEDRTVIGLAFEPQDLMLFLMAYRELGDDKDLTTETQEWMEGFFTDLTHTLAIGAEEALKRGKL